MAPEDLTALLQDIEEFGQRDPITLFEGQVLDGWNRYGCLMRLGVAVKQTELTPGINPVAFVKSRNLHRRHMTGSQRALAVVACSEWVANGSRSTPEPGSGVSEKQMAAEADVSDRTIRQAKLVATQATPEVVDAVRSGEMSLKAAVETTKPTVAMPIPMPTSGPVTVITLDPAAAVQLDPAPTPALVPVAEMTLQQKYDDLLEQYETQGHTLADTIAENNRMGAVFDADDKVKAAMHENKQLTAQVDQLRSSINGYINENGALKRRIQGLEKQLKKAGAQ
jgi:hypothetical protein